AVRVRSPSGGSTLMTLAPKSTSAFPHDGPDSTRDRSSTCTPASGLAPVTLWVGHSRPVDTRARDLEETRLLCEHLNRVPHAQRGRARRRRRHHRALESVRWIRTHD